MTCYSPGRQRPGRAHTPPSCFWGWWSGPVVSARKSTSSASCGAPGPPVGEPRTPSCAHSPPQTLGCSPSHWSAWRSGRRTGVALSCPAPDPHGTRRDPPPALLSFCQPRPRRGQAAAMCARGRSKSLTAVGCRAAGGSSKSRCSWKHTRP